MKEKLLLIFLISIVILPIYGIEQIPEWVKNNAELWSENQIEDESFLNALKFLIENNMIVIERISIGEDRIPEWVKNNVKWWSENQIEDESFLNALKFLIENNIITVEHIANEEKTAIQSGSEIFDVWSYKKDLYLEFEKFVTKDIHLKLIEENEQLYKEIGVDDDVNAIVILPVFTSTAYSENGFYDYFFDKCDDCTTVKILKNNYLHHHQGSQIGARVLETLGYKTITDIDLDKNPNILKKFDTVILLHNEYVTQSMFNSIVNHPHVIYLYPNALYAEIDVNYEKNEITLIRGHGYPESTIMNGFDWEFDNTHPYEYDIDCFDWEFYRIPNGEMLNCYPEGPLLSNIELLKEIKNLVN
jgi:predicted house-cleaning noncanonical NTP pyrophosphatase (MazG superfamily)